MKRTPLRRVSKKKKRGPPRSEKYKSWIKTLPCIVCGRYGCDPAHTKVIDYAGMSQKTSDFSCIPLCRPCHDTYHAYGRETEWAAHVGKDILAIVTDLQQRFYATFS